MKVSCREVAENRAALVDAARRLLQENGFDGAGVAEIGRRAGLTQGAIYSQFKSKDVLAAEAVRGAFAAGAAAWTALQDTAPDAVSAYIDAYLCDEHLTDVGSGCVVAACVSEIRRQDASIGAAFTAGFAELVNLIQTALPAASPEAARRGALTLISALVGSVATARAVAGTDPKLAREIISAAQVELGELALRREHGKPT